MEKVKFQVYRYNPDVDAKPYMKEYDLEIEPSDVKLLDAMIKLKAMDDSFSSVALVAKVSAVLMVLTSMVKTD